MYHGIKRGFEQVGVQVRGWPSLLDEATMAQFMADAQPDAVLEMNRWRDAAPGMPGSVPHVCWLVDAGNQSLASVTGSTLTYFISENWRSSYPERDRVACGWLAPGVDPHYYSYEKAELACEMAFVGHVPRPWTEAELQRALLPGTQGGPIFADFVEKFESRAGAADFADFCNDDYFEYGWSLMGLSSPSYEVDSKLRYDMSCRVVRGFNRHRMLQTAIESGHELAIYGSENFRLYPQYVSLHRGYVADPHELATIYRSTGANLHEGVGMHFRSLDCMAAGGLLMVPRGPDDTRRGGLAQAFVPDEHYVVFDPGEFSQVMRRVLGDASWRARVGLRASQAVHAGHTWRHRALQIIEDLRTAGD